MSIYSNPFCIISQNQISLSEMKASQVNHQSKKICNRVVKGGKWNKERPFQAQMIKSSAENFTVGSKITRYKDLRCKFQNSKLTQLMFIVLCIEQSEIKCNNGIHYWCFLKFCICSQGNIPAKAPRSQECSSAPSASPRHQPVKYSSTFQNVKTENQIAIHIK